MYCVFICLYVYIFTCLCVYSNIYIICIICNIRVGLRVIIRVNVIIRVRSILLYYYIVLLLYYYYIVLLLFILYTLSYLIANFSAPLFAKVGHLVPHWGTIFESVKSAPLNGSLVLL